MIDMKYYSKIYNQFNIINQCMNREFAMIPKVRALRVNSLRSLTQALELVHWDKNPVKLYRSVAKLKEIPFFTFNLKERSKETGGWFRDKFDSLIYEYDLFLDFDKNKGDKVSTIYDVLNEVKKLLEIFDEFELPYYVQFSGNKGFHVFIDGKYMPKLEIINGQIQSHKRIAEKLKESLDFKYLDLSNNGIGNRLCKVPYSLCPTEENQIEEEMNVVLPLSKKQIDTFKIENMKLKNVMNQVNPINKRGILERFDDLSNEQKIIKVKKFIKSIDI